MLWCLHIDLGMSERCTEAMSLYARHRACRAVRKRAGRTAARALSPAGHGVHAQRQRVPRAPQIELRDVHYAYPSRPNAPALRGVSLSLEPGRLLALVRAHGRPQGRPWRLTRLRSSALSACPGV
jgi:ABC-type multidrug transport system fused ATPase/permease subunit